MNISSALVCITLIAVTAGVAIGQERSTGDGSQNDQITWKTLKAMTDQANVTITKAETGANAMLACTNQRKLYAPADATADANGCVTLFDPTQLIYNSGTFSYNYARKL